MVPCHFGAGCTIRGIEHDEKYLHPPTGAGIPEPLFRNDCWMCACRPEGCVSAFSKTLLVFKPNMRRCCRYGANCKQQHLREHYEEYQHPLPWREEHTPFQGTGCVDIAEWVDG